MSKELTKTVGDITKKDTKNHEAHVDEVATSTDQIKEIFANVPFGVVSFADLEAVEESRDLKKRLELRLAQFMEMIDNVFWSESVENKISSFESLFNEFITVFRAEMGEGESETVATCKIEVDPDAELAEFELSELAHGSILNLIENTNGDGATSPRDPLDVDIAIIVPGWGNKEDNHYYPAEMLEKYSPVFEGAKMYATDHRDSEKSVRTEVSIIKEIVGHMDDGTPIGRTVIFDPDFAESTRNRAKAGQLNTLECSILAAGYAKKGKVDGKEAKIVESITEVNSVDWVTRAGAGGHAIKLSESEVNMEKEQEEKLEAVEEKAKPVVISEDETVAKEQEPVVDAEVESKPEPVVQLSESEIMEAVNQTNLPVISKQRLVEGAYESAEKLNQAIQAEIDYVKELTNSGKPTGLGESSSTKNEPMTEEVYNEGMDKIFANYGVSKGV